MDEDFQEPAIEETQTYYSTKNLTKEPIPTEHRSPSPTKDDLESSKSKKFVDASNSESSLCFETFKPFDNYMPISERQLVRNLQNISKVLYAQVVEDNWVNHKEADASYANLRAVVEGFATNADNNWNHYNITINSVMGTIDQINGARIEEKTTFLKALSIVSETLEANTNAKLPEIFTQFNAFQTSLNTISSQSSSQPTGPVIDVTPPEHPKSPQAAPKSHRGKGTARDTDESPPKLVKASTKAHLDKEEKQKKAAKEARLLEMNKFELIKKAKLNVLNKERREKLTEAKELRTKRIDQIGDFRVTEWDKLGPVIKKKKNKVVGELMTSLGKKYHRLKVIPRKIGITLSLLTPRQVLYPALGRNKIAHESPKVCILRLECNRSLPEGVLFVNNLVTELPKNDLFFIDVFGNEAFQRMNNIYKWQQSSLAVVTNTASGNSNLAVGMTCAFYSQQSSPKLDAPDAFKFSRIK
nr:hypothetical protein [Tanacetum cinerariifolium]